MIKAIIFDLDMCIFDTRTLGERILEPVLLSLHTSSVPEDIQREIDRMLWTTSLEDIIEIFSLPQDVAESMRQAHLQLVVPSTIKTFGDEYLISAMSGYHILVTSGYDLWQSRKIEQLGVSVLFDEVIIDVIDNPQVRKGKKQIFLELMRRHGWYSDEIVVVGDNPHSELKAGRELNMITVQILRPTIEKKDGFDHYISSFLELLPIVGEKPHK